MMGTREKTKRFLPPPSPEEKNKTLHFLPGLIPHSKSWGTYVFELPLLCTTSDDQLFFFLMASYGFQ